MGIWPWSVGKDLDFVMTCWKKSAWSKHGTLKSPQLSEGTTYRWCRWWQGTRRHRAGAARTASGCNCGILAHTPLPCECCVYQRRVPHHNWRGRPASPTYNPHGTQGHAGALRRIPPPRRNCNEQHWPLFWLKDTGTFVCLAAWMHESSTEIKYILIKWWIG